MLKITKEILYAKSNIYVLRHILGKNHPDGTHQACENWLQVEIAKKLSRDYDIVRMEVGENNHDITFLEEDLKIAVEIKFWKKSDRDISKIRESLSHKNIDEGYLLVISSSEIQGKEGKSGQIIKEDKFINIYSEKYK